MAAGPSLAVLRLLNDGRRDATFGTDGKVTHHRQQVWARAIALDPAHRLVVGAHSGWHLGLMRLSARSGCGVTVEAPPAIGPGEATRAVATFADVSGRAASVAGHELAIAATAADGGRTVEAVAATDEAGRAAVSLDLEPGRWDVTASYAGGDLYELCRSEPVRLIARGATSLEAEPALVSTAREPLLRSLAPEAALTASGAPLPGRRIVFVAAATSSARPRPTSGAGPRVLGLLSPSSSPVATSRDSGATRCTSRPRRAES